MVLKQQAEAGEDYDEAERLSKIEGGIAKAGRELEGVEVRKQAAVAREDYGEAKALKVETDRLKEVMKSLAESVERRRMIR